MAENLLHSNELHTIPGWYRDPTGESDQRFWDGSHWTLLTRDDVTITSDLEIDGVQIEGVQIEGAQIEGVQIDGLQIADMKIDDLEIEDIQLGLEADQDTTFIPGRRSTDRPNDPRVATTGGENPSLFEVSSGAERRVVRLEPAATELPRRRKDDPAPGRSLFADRDETRAPSFAPITEGTRSATPVGKIAGTNRAKATATPAERAQAVPPSKGGRNRPPSYPRNRSAAASRSRRRLQLLALALGASGLAIGYVSGSSDNERVALEAEKSLTESVNSRVAASGRPGEVIVLERELQAASQEAKTSTDELQEVSDELGDVRDDLAATEAELSEVTTELELVTEHNELLITWFTDDLVVRGQTEWDNEVTRVCALVDDGALLSSDLLNFTRSMELIGTEAGLYRAVAACAAG